MTELHIRGVSSELHEQFARGARVRGIAYAEYLRRLVELHQYLLDPVSLEEHGILQVLDRNGLEPATG